MFRTQSPLSVGIAPPRLALPSAYLRCELGFARPLTGLVIHLHQDAELSELSLGRSQSEREKDVLIEFGERAPMSNFYEHKKIAKSMSEFHETFGQLMELDFQRADLVHMFPIFVGHLNLARFLSLYEIYKKTDGVLGHIADVGVWKGASFFYFIKLVEIFESRNLTQVHGFDWFKGMKTTSELDNPALDNLHQEATHELVQKCLEIQKLDHVGFVHDVDLTNDLPKFFEENPSLTFKLVFLDCGTHEALRQSIKHFWSRLNRGGILILDHANDSRVAAEAVALREFFGDSLKINSIPFCGWPSGYIVKE